MSPSPFRIEVPDAVLADLRERIQHARWPDEITGIGWAQGTSLDYLRRLTRYWTDGYDWREQERRLNAVPHFRAQVDGFGLHYLHVRGRVRPDGPPALPLIICHGWPSSFAEMMKVLGPLSDPAAHGGDPDDAFDVVVPSLPGFGFSDRPAERGMNVARISELLVKLMSEVLGYRRFGAQGGDWGGVITHWLGYAYPAHVVGISVTQLLARRVGPTAAASPEEKRGREMRMLHAHLNRNTPQTLSYALNDSPVGLASWMVEKFRQWGDPQDGRTFEDVYTMDEILTNVMIYWVTQTTASAGRLYYEDYNQPSHVPRGRRIEVPMGAFVGPRGDGTLPALEAQRENYADIRRWTVTPVPGHFTALEKPQQMVEEIRALFRPLRQPGAPG